MIQPLLNFTCLAIVTLGIVAAQDSGEGYVFKCDQPGNFALTFDDGPSPYTGTLLGILKSNAIKATFFSVGTQAADASISKYLKQAYDEGHQIASHTNTHADLNKLSPEKIKSEMSLTADAIRRATGVVPAMMRPPYGNCNEQCRGIMKEMGYTVIQWSVDSNDWQYMGQPDKWDLLVSNVNKVVSASNPQSDSFISLQHDIHQFSVERTPKVIESIKAKGYKFVTVSQCLGNRFPMYQNLANPDPSTSVSTPGPSSSTPIPSSSTAAPNNGTSSVTGSITSPTSLVSSISTSAATTLSSTKLSSTTEQTSAPTSVSPTSPSSQPPRVTNNLSLNIPTSRYVVSLLAVCLGYAIQQ
ncbi:glycoside hydrolase/deacetylase [Basidiobolus meristosporus CBS 931.73]|uniref:Glycoside hydrolase/deacetylase n=1 Tax=Basidiobolus meristosporus CBS 931.73 TaxID=1314790 RepID=A0A1Y1YK53_9FUNG|nr:glycoside hydrolase/deacetylase [Basidiobolus meristosporus CBS 931.73]|eukprot:ORX98407.1 glycoside hydrolase/deacetylase [Basidiobolus meristosporus CBS 931.73]